MHCVYKCFTSDQAQPYFKPTIDPNVSKPLWRQGGGGYIRWGWQVAGMESFLSDGAGSDLIRHFQLKALIFNQLQ